MQITTINIVLQYMLSKAQSKHIRSLTHQKFRNEHQQFIAEGAKIAGEWLSSKHKILRVIATIQWINENRLQIAAHPEAEVVEVTEQELTSITALQTPNNVLLVVAYPAAQTLPVAANKWYMALDNIQDPGNMGTLLRIADWYGIGHVLCNDQCVDVYNPKVVQSAMGAHTRVVVHYTDLPVAISQLHMPVYAAVLGGTNVYECSRSESGVLVIGNESKGISEAVTALATHCVTIPRKGGAESLNAAVSAGILCALLLPE